MLPAILVGGAASAMLWKHLGEERKRQNLDPSFVSRFDILKDKIQGYCSQFYYNQIQNDYNAICAEFDKLTNFTYEPLNNEQAMSDYEDFFKDIAPENSRKADRTSHKLRRQFEHLQDAIDKELDIEKQKDDDKRFLTLLRLSFKVLSLQFKTL